MMVLVPISIKAANEFVARIHRHNKPVKVARFACAVADEHGAVRGVAIAASPSARPLCDGFTIEIARVATDGARNACSMLYAACARAARALGYRHVITYTLLSEPGSSLRAAGFSLETSSAGGRPWTSNTRRHRNDQPISMELKNRWGVRFGKENQP